VRHRGRPQPWRIWQVSRLSDRRRKVQASVKLERVCCAGKRGDNFLWLTCLLLSLYVGVANARVWCTFPAPLPRLCALPVVHITTPPLRNTLCAQAIGYLTFLSFLLPPGPSSNRRSAPYDHSTAKKSGCGAANAQFCFTGHSTQGVGVRPPTASTIQRALPASNYLMISVHHHWTPALSERRRAGLLNPLIHSECLFECGLFNVQEKIGLRYDDGLITSRNVWRCRGRR
jgi:hypothetical protein